MESWKKLDETVLFKRYRSIINRKFQLPNGLIEEYDVIKAGNPVCTLALTKNNEVILAKQFRVGPERIVIELPGGGAEPGEDFQAAAARELLEETGYEGDMQFVATSLTDAYSTALRYNYVATNCKKIQEPASDDREFTEVVLMPLDEFKKYIRTGQLTDVTTAYLGLDFLNLLN